MPVIFLSSPSTARARTDFSDSRELWKVCEEALRSLARERREAVRASCSAREVSRADSVERVLSEAVLLLVVGWGRDVDAPVVVAVGVDVEAVVACRWRRADVPGGAASEVDKVGGNVDDAVDSRGAGTSSSVSGRLCRISLSPSRIDGFSPIDEDRGDGFPDVLACGVCIKISSSFSDDTSSVSSTCARTAISSRHCFRALICSRFWVRSACNVCLRDGFLRVGSVRSSWRSKVRACSTFYRTLQQLADVLVGICRREKDERTAETRAR